METVYKTYKAEVKGKDEDGNLDIFIPVSNASMDRDGEVVEPDAFKKTIPKFMKHPVLVSSHDYRNLTNQIGEWTRIKSTDDGIEGKPKYYTGAGNEQADWAYYLASRGVAAFSIGFMPKVWEDGDGQKTPRRTYKEIELLEISQVIIPSNRDAIMSMRAKSVDPVIQEMCDKSVELVTKPEETEDYIRIPVKDCKITATINVSEKEGIKALYCGGEKEIATYLFAKDKGWTMEKARAWIKEHSKGITQEEIIDEIDYLNSCIVKVGLNDKATEALKNLMKRIPVNDITVEKKDISITDVQETIKQLMEVK